MCVFEIWDSSGAEQVCPSQNDVVSPGDSSKAEQVCPSQNDVEEQNDGDNVILSLLT